MAFKSPPPHRRSSGNLGNAVAKLHRQSKPGAPPLTDSSRPDPYYHYVDGVRVPAAPSEYTDLLTSANALIADARHRIFFMLHDHHVLPHHYPEAERKRRDQILLRRGWDAAVRPVKEPT